MKMGNTGRLDFEVEEERKLNMAFSATNFEVLLGYPDVESKITCSKLRIFIIMA